MMFLVVGKCRFYPQAKQATTMGKHFQKIFTLELFIAKDTFPKRAEIYFVDIYAFVVCTLLGFEKGTF